MLYEAINMDENNEYKIPETEGMPTQQQYEDTASSGQLSEGKKPLAFFKSVDGRKIILPLGIFVVIFLAYKVFDFYGAKKTQRIEQQKAQMQNITMEPAVVVSQKPTYATESSRTPESNNKNQNYDALKHKISTIEANVYQNDVKLTNLNNNVNVVQENLVVVDKNVKQIADVLQQELAQIERTTQQSANKSAKHRKIKKPYVIKYHVRAMVPGRAWIESADGRYSKTIKVGDELKGHGTVDYILFKDGMVLMSDGSYIQYGENDS